MTLIVSLPARAQEPEPSTRTALLEREQARKAAELKPYVPGTAERYLNRAETILVTGMRWHPFFQSAYSGGGFTVGAGYRTFVGSYNTVDVRGSITPSGYKRIEGEFLAPRLFNRQGELVAVAGWREATQVGFYGIGSATPVENKTVYGFTQPYGRADLTFRPARGPFLIRGGVEVSRWDQGAGSGNDPSVEEVYTPDSLTGLGAAITYLHSKATAGFDSRPSPGYARRGGFYGITLHDFSDTDSGYGFTQVDYEAIQHVPVMRETWVLSFRGAVSTTQAKSDQAIPFFMLPAVGGGSSLRAYSSWRFRDRHSLELQGEWRIMVNRYVDTAVFYDTGKVVGDTNDLDLKALKHDAGFGFRFHGPFSTPLRIDLAKGSDGFHIVWAAAAVF
jgi:hypothetical protein